MGDWDYGLVKNNNNQVKIIYGGLQLTSLQIILVPFGAYTSLLIIISQFGAHAECHYEW